MFWSPRDADPVRLVAYFTLTAVALGALWYVGRLGRENIVIRKKFEGLVGD